MQEKELEDAKAALLCEEFIDEEKIEQIEKQIENLSPTPLKETEQSSRTSSINTDSRLSSSMQQQRQNLILLNNSDDENSQTDEEKSSSSTLEEDDYEKLGLKTNKADSDSDLDEEERKLRQKAKKEFIKR